MRILPCRRTPSAGVEAGVRGQDHICSPLLPPARARQLRPAALAVEAAAQQGKYEQMAAKLFETQPQWGEKQDSQAALFRTYAEELRLDMGTYDAAVAAEETKERIRRDVADGKALGVTGTPTFFLDGDQLTLNTEEQFRQLLDDAVK